MCRDGVAIRPVRFRTKVEDIAQLVVSQARDHSHHRQRRHLRLHIRRHPREPPLRAAPGLRELRHGHRPARRGAVVGSSQCVVGHATASALDDARAAVEGEHVGGRVRLCEDERGQQKGKDEGQNTEHGGNGEILRKAGPADDTTRSPLYLRRAQAVARARLSVYITRARARPTRAPGVRPSRRAPPDAGGGGAGGRRAARRSPAPALPRAAPPPHDQGVSCRYAAHATA